MRLTLRQLQVFVSVADSGSTAAAGAALGLSQSACSAALKELEGHWDCALFDRVGRGLQLNATGRWLLAGARQLLADAQMLERQMAGAMAAVDLQLAASSTIGNHLLPPLLAAFVQGHPGSRLALQIANTAQVAAAVAQMQVDAGLVEGISPLPELRMTAWQQDCLQVVAAHGRQLRTLAQLRQARWLLREPGSGTRQVFEQQVLPLLGGQVQALELGSTAAIVAAASAGAGVACVPESALPAALASGTLQPVEVALPPLQRTLWLLEHPQRQRSPALAQLLGLSV